MIASAPLDLLRVLQTGGRGCEDTWTVATSVATRPFFAAAESPKQALHAADRYPTAEQSAKPKRYALFATQQIKQDDPTTNEPVELI